MCLYPRLILNPKYKENGKNKGQIPPINDGRVLYVPIGCGNCMECRKQKATEWRVRLLEDIKTNTNGKMITLTFSNESIKQLIEQKPTKHWEGLRNLEGYELDNEIATRATRLFLERWRKTYTKSLRHWLITELGHQGTENIHLHGIVWTNETMQQIENHWQYGWIWKGKMINGKLQNYVNGQTVSYTVKYVNKMDEIHKEYKPIILTSNGIGNNYTKRTDWIQNKYNGTNTKETYRTRTGHKIALPTYWRDKIYTDEEKEQLWIQKLDKQERWVNGEKVSIKKDLKQYWQLLAYHRQINAQLGYGNTYKNWNRTEYEQQRRNMLTATRIQNAKQPTAKQQPKT